MAMSCITDLGSRATWPSVRSLRSLPLRVVRNMLMVNDMNLPRPGTFVGRARSPGNSHPLVVTVRGGDVVDITSKQAPTVRDICEMDDPAGYVRSARGEAIGLLEAIAANSFEAGVGADP